MGTAKQQIQEEFLNMLTKEHVRVTIWICSGLWGCLYWRRLGR
jgi:sRNA-binding regulator protein Hfq